MKEEMNLQRFAGEQPQAQQEEAAEVREPENGQVQPPATEPEEKQESPGREEARLEAYRAMEPVLRRLSRSLGTPEGDYAALEQAMQARMDARQQEQLRQGADRLVRQWQQEEQSLRETYPGFSLEQEMENGAFRRLLRSHVDMRTAYEVLHKDEIIPAAMAYAARTVERKLAQTLASRDSRPEENGTQAAAAAFPGSRVEELTPKEIAQLCLRVQRGERISFG